MTEDETFGQRVGRTRTALGLSQVDLARQAGISPMYINDLERGRRKMPRPATAQRIAEALLWPLPYIWTYADAVRIVCEQWQLLADAYVMIEEMDDGVARPLQIGSVLIALNKAIPEHVWEGRS